MKTKVNLELIKKEIFNRYKPFIKNGNNRTTTATLLMFSGEMGIHLRTCYDILNGNMSLDMLYRVIDLLEIPEDQVFIKEDK